MMGVSGSGKTTVGAALAQRLRVPFADADDFHPEANIAKMSAGIPLDDDDRGPWLEAIAAWLAEHSADRWGRQLLRAQARLPRRAERGALRRRSTSTCTATATCSPRGSPAARATSCRPP